MTSKLKHLAIVSDRPTLMCQFYTELFRLDGTPPEADATAGVMSDGYVGFNVNRRAPGRPGGFDHFGFEVENVEDVRDRLRDDYSSIELSQRPSNRPFAGMSMHDPAGNVFDLSQKNMTNRTGLYVEEPTEHSRRVDHVVLRVVEADRAARFYADVFGLDEMEKGPSDPNTYLTDGNVTFVISPWRIGDYTGGGIERPALEHIGSRGEYRCGARGLGQDDPAQP